MDSRKLQKVDFMFQDLFKLLLFLQGTQNKYVHELWKLKQDYKFREIIQLFLQ